MRCAIIVEGFFKRILIPYKLGKALNLTLLILAGSQDTGTGRYVLLDGRESASIAHISGTA